MRQRINPTRAISTVTAALVYSERLKIGLFLGSEYNGELSKEESLSSYQIEGKRASDNQD